MFVMLHIQTYGDAMEGTARYTAFRIDIFIMLHIPEALWHAVMPWTTTWVNEKKYSNARVQLCYFYYSVNTCLLVYFLFIDV